MKAMLLFLALSSVCYCATEKQGSYSEKTLKLKRDHIAALFPEVFKRIKNAKDPLSTHSRDALCRRYINQLMDIQNDTVIKLAKSKNFESLRSYLLANETLSYWAKFAKSKVTEKELKQSDEILFYNLMFVHTLSTGLRQVRMWKNRQMIRLKESDKALLAQIRKVKETLALKLKVGFSFKW